MDSDSRADFLRNKASSLGLEEFVAHNTSFLGIESNYKTPLRDKENTDAIFKDGCSICPTYALPSIQTEESSDSRQRLIENPFYVDKRTGIPFPCLSFLAMHLIPVYMVLVEYWNKADTEVNGTQFRFLGSRCSGTDVFLRDIMPKLFTRTETHKEYYGATVVALTSDLSRSSLIQDTEATYPGYLRLKVPSSCTDFPPKNLHRSEGNTYLKKLNVPVEMKLPRYATKCLMGFKCKEFPSVAEEWKYRQRKAKWPSNEALRTVQESGCIIIAKHHQSSSQPGIEWKYDFSISEAILFIRGLSIHQVHGFYVVKILLDHCTSRLNCRLKIKHITSAFFNSCEHIPNEMWVTNFGGCIMYIISYMTTCLQEKNLPNYFVSKRNMLFGLSDEDINAIYIQLEALRLFPLETMVHIAELHSFRYAANLKTLILQDCKRFTITSEIWSAYRDVLLPGTIKTVKFLTRRGFYEQASMLLCYTLNSQHLYEDPMSRTRSSIEAPGEFYCNALGNLKQEISRVTVAMHFESYFGQQILDLLLKLDGIFLKDILPMEDDPNIAWLRVPEDKIDNYELLAEFLHEFGKKELRRLNTKLAESAFSKAIQCLEKAIKNKPVLDVSQIEDEMLKLDIQSQRENILRELREKIKDCYIQMFYISKIHLSYDPIQNYMHAIEELCKDLPEMSGIVSVMYTFLRIPNKRKEYSDLYDSFLDTGARHSELPKVPTDRY